VCRLRSVGRSVFLHGDSGRNDVPVGRRELFLGNRSSFKAGGHERGSLVGSFGTLALSRGFRCAFPVPFFSSGSRRVFGGASFVVRNTGGLTFLPCRSFGAPSSDKRNAGHGDPIPLRHELG
jgi:hypothetical protein